MPGGHGDHGLADERLYYPVHAVPYTPARHFAKGKSDPAFRTKQAIGADLAVRARAVVFAFRAVVADSAYVDQDGFRGELADAGLPFVMALRPRRGTWAYGADAHTPMDAARELRWGGPDDPGGWHPVPGPSGTGTPRPGTRPTRRWAGGGRTAPGGWWWPPPTRPPCWTRPPGISSRTCPLTFFTEPGQLRSGPGKFGGAAWLIAPCSSHGLGVLPPARLVREPLMGTCGLIADS